MAQVTATELASKLGVSKARVSQYVAEGKLDGCFRGAGRQRRFDLAASAAALGRRLDAGQMLGNGAGTRAALRDLVEGPMRGRNDVDPPVPAQPGAGATVLPSSDAGRYELARAQKAEEETRRLRRQNALDEGLFVLAAEVELATAKLVAQEIAGMETVLRDGARAVADRLGVDMKAVRAILIETWRKHRGERTEALMSDADGQRLTDAETAADI